MDDIIIISNLNDFIFCPASIYFHNLYGSTDTLTYQSHFQIDGSKAHETVDNGSYSSRKDIITGLDIYSEQYRLIGKIDIYDARQKRLVERKKHISKIYDGYVFQIYAQCYCMREMGYEVNQLMLHSIDDNKSYPVMLPENDTEMQRKFENTIRDMRSFQLEKFIQTNPDKCKNCIYEPACDRALYRGKKC